MQLRLSLQLAHRNNFEKKKLWTHKTIIKADFLSKYILGNIVSTFLRTNELTLKLMAGPRTHISRRIACHV